MTRNSYLESDANDGGKQSGEHISENTGRAGDIMLKGKESFRAGPFAEINVPANWELYKEDQGLLPGHRYQYILKPEDNRSDIRVFFGGMPLNKQEGQAFDQVLHASKDLSKPKILYDQAWESDPKYASDKDKKAETTQLVNSLAGALGRNSIGDNQFTNTAKAGEPEAPAFHLEKLTVESIDGKPVLAVSGTFRNFHTGETSAFYSGVVAEMKSNIVGNQVCEAHKVCLQADRLDSFNNSMPVYEQLLKSIKW